MMKLSDKYVAVEIDAGEYWLGDPCYCFEHDDWIALLTTCNSFQEPIGTFNGSNVLAFNTKHGDGAFEGSDRFEYGVDSGCIGLVPVGLETKSPGDSSKKVKLKRDLCYKADGLLCFGNVMIDTDV